jgi:hypothetical protein
MILTRRVSDVLDNHVTLDLECIDRMYLNVYQPKLQMPQMVYRFLRDQAVQGSVSSKHFQSMTRAFVAAVERFADTQGVPLRPFAYKERKDDVAAQFRKRFEASAATTGAVEGVLFIGKAQEKARCFRTEERTNAATGQKYPWIVEASAMVNQYYFYAIDEDFGPFFLKFSSYFPYGAKLCINGHEYLKRQLAKEGIAFEALDNGIRCCADPGRMQEIADGLSATKIDRLLRKWLARLPHPFAAAHRKAGYVYDVSMLQSEFARTQVLDRPATGRAFFEEVIRDNLDMGRPDQVQLIFERRITKRTPGKFRTRVLTQGVTPSLHVDYKSNRIKQYFKEERALRTETTINNPRDFGIGKRLVNLPALREIGFRANRRLLDVQKVGRDVSVGETAFREVTQPCRVKTPQGGTQRGSALPYGDGLVLALFQVLLLMRLLPCGFRSRELREHLAPLTGEAPESWTQGRLTYQLRRLRLHGLIERVQGTHRYEVTSRGLRIASFFTRSYARLVRPGLSDILDDALTTAPNGSSLQQAMDRLDHALNEYAATSKT